MLKLAKGNTEAIRWKNMRLDSDDSAVDDATVTMTVNDEAGMPISGGTNIDCPLMANGDYRGKIPSTLGYDIGDTGTIVLEASNADGTGEIVVPYMVVGRGSNG